MGELIRRVIRSEIKGINEKDFTVDVTMSDETIDRYKEVIKASAWKKRMGSYKAHPILLSSHNYHGLMNQIGDAAKISAKEDGLKATFKYYAGQGNPEADWAWVLASKGVAAYSVGFIRHAGRYVDPDEDYDDDEEMKGYQKADVRYVYDDVELLECSHVTVPANPSCLQNSFDQGAVLRGLEEKAYPLMAELEVELKKLADLASAKKDPPEEKHPEVPKETNEEDTIMKLEDFEKMAESLKEKLTTELETLLKSNVVTLTDVMTAMMKTVADEVAKKTIEMFNEELQKKKELEVEEVVGDGKQDEVETDTKDVDGVLDVFRSVTAEMEKAFADKKTSD